MEPEKKKKVVKIGVATGLITVTALATGIALKKRKGRKKDHLDTETRPGFDGKMRW